MHQAGAPMNMACRLNKRYPASFNLNFRRNIFSKIPAPGKLPVVCFNSYLDNMLSIYKTMIQLKYEIYCEAIVAVMVAVEAMVVDLIPNREKIQQTLRI